MIAHGGYTRSERRSGDRKRCFTYPRTCHGMWGILLSPGNFAGPRQKPKPAYLGSQFRGLPLEGLEQGRLIIGTWRDMAGQLGKPFGLFSGFIEQFFYAFCSNEHPASLSRFLTQTCSLQLTLVEPAIDCGSRNVSKCPLGFVDVHRRILPKG